jgi:hypothetical protein
MVLLRQEQVLHPREHCLATEGGIPTGTLQRGGRHCRWGFNRMEEGGLSSGNR